MLVKYFLAPAILTLVALPFCSYKAAGFTNVVESAPVAENAIRRTSFPIESILYNPAIYKKQLSRNTVQAIGNKQAGQAHFVIHFRKEALHGQWQTFYNSDQPCDSGALFKNIPTGEWKTWYANGRLKTIRNYSAEKYHYVKADLRRSHPKEQRFAITRLGAQKAARYFKPQYEKNVNAGGAQSLLQTIQLNTSGTAETYHPPFSNCLHHGAFVNYAENGAVKDSGYFVNGLQHGLWKQSMNSDTMQAVGFFRHGIRHGQWKYYNTEGRLVYTEWYTLNGKRTDSHYFK